MNSPLQPVTRSLKRRIVLPLLVFSLVAAGIAVFAIQQMVKRQLLGKLRERAELVANTVNYAAESIQRRGELQRIVTAIGAETEVTLVVVVGGEPSRVLATTRQEWFDKPLGSLPLADVREDLEAVLKSKQRHHGFHPASHEFDLTSPLLLNQLALSDWDLSSGAVMVHLDTRPTERAIRAAVIQFSAAFVLVLGILTFVGYHLINARVLKPLAIIGQLVKKRGNTDRSLGAAAATGDEIGQLARTLDDALTRAEFARRDLENQKFALDQHAIVAITDTQGRITYANDRFCAISQYSREELLGQDHRLLNSSHHATEFFHGMWTTIAHGAVWHGEIRNRAKDGSFYWVETSIVPLLGEDGKPHQYIAIRTDITTRKRAEDELLSAKISTDNANDLLLDSLKQADLLRDEAKAASEAKSEFLATMSHEIRTPMNGVLGFTNLLLDTPLSAEQRDYTSTIKNSGEALLVIINDILDFSKIEAGKLTVEKLSFDIGQTTRECIGLLSARAGEKGVHLKSLLPENAPTHLVSDPNRVRQVILNLAGNAIKFTPAGGSVSVQMTLLATAPSAGGEPASAPVLRISIIDSGIGIAKEKQARLFQKFSQADSSTTRRYGGTGLGLAISKHLVELMGGEIGLESEDGKGSTFWFTLPLTPKQGTSTLPLSSPALNRAGNSGIKSVGGLPSGLRILVAEDMLANQLLVTKFLSKLGCESDLARNGKEAVELYQQKHYDLILMDCHMPVLDGFEATQEIRRIEQSSDRTARHIPIVALTAGTLDDEKDKFTHCGMDDHLTKPFSPAQLTSLLAKWCSAEETRLAP